MSHLINSDIKILATGKFFVVDRDKTAGTVGNEKLFHNIQIITFLYILSEITRLEVNSWAS